MMPYRVIRGDETPQGPFHTILDGDGRMLGLDDLAMLAQRPEPSATIRYIDFIVTDESRPRHGKPYLRPQCLTFASVPTFTFLDTGLVIGTIDRLVIYPAGNVPGTEGYSAVATAIFSDTMLGALAWQTAQEGTFNGVCLKGVGLPDATGEIRSYDARTIMLCSLDGSCIVNARVLRLRETPRHERSA